MNVKTKKNIFAVVYSVMLIAASFCTGRFIRLRGAEQSGNRVEQSINGADVSVDKIGDGANIIGGLLGGMGTNTNIAIGQLDQATITNLELQSIINECKRTFELSQRELENSIGRIDAAIDTADYILAVAELKAEQNERTLSRLAELLGLSDEMPGEQ